MTHIGVGDRFGRWAVIAKASPRVYGNKEVARWECVCDCGEQRSVTQQSLKGGRSTSCGCFARETSAVLHTKHGGVLGGKASPEYSAWRAIIRRCENPADKRYGDYGGRGIKICPEWRANFSAFLDDVGNRPSPKHSIDRMNNERGYEPGNCRWAVAHHQMTNRRNSRFVDVNGKRVALSDLAASCGVPANTLRFRILKGWSIDEATSKPVRAKGPARNPIKA